MAAPPIPGAPAPSTGWDDGTSPPPPNVDSGLFYYGVSLRELNVAVVTILIVLVLLVLVLTFLKARRGWFRRGQNTASGHEQDPGTLQAVGDRGLLIDSRPGTGRGLDEASIEQVGKVYTYSMPLKSTADASASVDEETGFHRASAGGPIVNHHEGLGGSFKREQVVSEEQVKLTEAGLGSKRIGDGDAEVECTVCLAEYKDAELLKKLNACGHSFHQDCIDAWLRCNTSCPLCRTSLQQKTEQEKAAADEELPLSTAGTAEDDDPFRLFHGGGASSEAVVVEMADARVGSAGEVTASGSSRNSSSTKGANQDENFVSIPIR